MKTMNMSMNFFQLQLFLLLNIEFYYMINNEYKIVNRKLKNERHNLKKKMHIIFYFLSQKRRIYDNIWITKLA